MARGIAGNRILVGGVLLGAALAVGAPAGAAAAHEGNPSSDAVGRHPLDNPAPGVRVTQAIGDRIYNQKTAVNRALDASPSGRRYHEMFGTPNHDDPHSGTNGTYRGILNTPGAGGVGPKELYDFGREHLGWAGEADLPAAVVKAVAGRASGGGHDHGEGEEGHGSDENGVAAQPVSLAAESSGSGCVISAGKTYTVRCG
ncbi:hypothetical protein [Mycolicibacterium palauense]|uniref:hypothetical protein n=1 Tax=Mycolicibacterium palauense TaxID=2034511 RepID=UPI000BFEBD64|nr:hypothetical protein [Mycolicibacterium palauense]